MTILTAIEIATNHPNGDISIEVVQDKETNKWSSFMYLMRDGNIHKLMLSFAINEKFKGFDTAKEAQEEMIAIRDFAIQYYNEKIDKQYKWEI